MKPIKPMTTDEYRATLDKLGLTQLAAGKLFAVGARTSRRWALGEARVPMAVAMLLRLMLKRQLRLEVPLHKDGSQVWDLTAELTVLE
jgi:hypothetical protein